jgi:hypothetical protein
MTMSSIVPPKPQMRTVTRRPKAFRLAQLCLVLSILAAVSIATYLASRPPPRSALIVCLLASGSALIAGICALVYRFVEVPRVVTIKADSGLIGGGPPVIHLNRNA